MVLRKVPSLCVTLSAVEQLEGVISGSERDHRSSSVVVARSEHESSYVLKLDLACCEVSRCSNYSTRPGLCSDGRLAAGGLIVPVHQSL
uniref:Secreted protein n=1 Tax=Knipowitschia caucasica TaxID=637954 RepID=A0AAV2LCN3_KNICA